MGLKARRSDAKKREECFWSAPLQMISLLWMRLWSCWRLDTAAVQPPGIGLVDLWCAGLQLVGRRSGGDPFVLSGPHEPVSARGASLLALAVTALVMRLPSLAVYRDCICDTDWGCDCNWVCSCARLRGIQSVMVRDNVRLILLEAWLRFQDVSTLVIEQIVSCWTKREKEKKSHAGHSGRASRDVSSLRTGVNTQMSLCHCSPVPLCRCGGVAQAHRWVWKGRWAVQEDVGQLAVVLK